MRYGMGWGCPWGDPEVWVIVIATSDFRTGASITFLSLFTQYYQLVIDGKISGAPIYVTAGTTAILKGNYSFPKAPHLISVVGVGQWSTPGAFDVTAAQNAYVAARANRIHLDIIDTPEQFSYGDNGQFSNWQINGVTRFSNCRTVLNRATWGELDFSIVSVGGIHIVTLSLGSSVVARGTISGNGIVTLVEVNSSGISGVVTLAYTADCSGEFETAFSPQFNLYYQKDTPVVTFTAPTAIVYGASFDSPILTAGTWYVVVRRINDDGLESANTDSHTIQMGYTPAEPGVPFYVSGGAAATTIQYLASTDVTSTYNIYDSDVSGVLPSIATQTAVAGSGTLSKVLNALSNMTFTGTRYVVVRAVLAGTESGNSVSLAIQYITGVVQTVAPNPPQVKGITTTGKTLAVDFVIDTLNSDAVPTKIQLFVSSSSIMDYTTELAHLNLGTISTRFAVGTIPGIVPTNGLYYFAIRTASVTGKQSTNTDVYGPIKLSSVIPNAPTFVVTGVA